MSALNEVQFTESSASLPPGLVRSIVNEVAWKVFDAYKDVSISFKVMKIIPVTIKLGSLTQLWTNLFGDRPTA